MKYKLSQELTFIVVVCLLSILIRIWGINTDLLYHRDQGMVAMDIYRIWHDGKISLLGAPTDVDGLFHSPIYYWLLTPFYALGRGDLAFPAIFQIAFEITTLPLLYLSLKKLFNKKTAYLTLVFYAISYGLISYSRWFITVPFILPLTNIFLYTLVFNKGIFINSFLVGVITQINAAIGVFYLPFILFHFRKKLNIKSILSIILGFLLPSLPLLIFQFRHDFVTFKALLTFIKNPSTGVGISFSVLGNKARRVAEIRR